MNQTDYRQHERGQVRGNQLASGRVAAPLAALLYLAASLWNLAGASPWWDEGWTLSVARTWAEQGFYGRLLGGQLAPPGLEAALPTTGLVALSFRLLGVGLWQGRLPIVLCMLGALALLAYLARSLYGRNAAAAALLVLLLTPMHRQLHPLLVARQVLAEPAMLLLLLAGYAGLWQALRRSRWWLTPAALAWALALMAKAQTLPFWLAASLTMLALAALWRRWDWAIGVAAASLGALLGWRALLAGQAWLLAGHTAQPIPIVGMYTITAFVPIAQIRYNTLYRVVLFGLPTCVGLAVALWRSARAWRSARDQAALLRWGLLALAGSWLLWFALLSVGDERYLFPATFVGSLFVGALVAEACQGKRIGGLLREAALTLGRRMPLRQGLPAVLLLAFAAMSMPVTLGTLGQAYTARADGSAARVAAWLDQQTPPDALIETYNSEIHFLAHRRYHFPPDQVHVDLIRRILTGDFDQPISYDPLAADPDYLVVGGLPRDWGLYAPVLASGAFEPLETIGDYAIYRRSREVR